MKKVIMGIMLQNRFEEVKQVQNLLSEYGCFIKTRLGLHQQAEAENLCTEKGLIIIEFVQKCDPQYKELKEKLQAVEGVEVRLMEF